MVQRLSLIHICGLQHEYFSGVLNGLKVQAEKQGYDITFINTCFENRKMSYLEHCKYRNFEGVAIVCADFNDAGVMELMNSEVPVVTIDYLHHNCTAVSSNNIQGMEDLVRYIYSQGHRRIAYIHGQQNGSAVTKDRLTSFYRTMDELKLEVPDEYIRTADYLETREDVYKRQEPSRLQQNFCRSRIRQLQEPNFHRTHQEMHHDLYQIRQSEH